MSIASRLIRIFNETFRNRNHVYRYTGDPGPADPRLSLDRYERAEEVAPDVREAIVRWGGPRAWASDADALARGSTMYAGRLGGAPASVWLAHPGRRFLRWFVPLRAEDVVLWRGRTGPEFRGRGVSPSVMRAVVTRERRAGADAWVDVAVHNVPSIRAIEKAGFRRVGTFKPLSPKEVFGEEPPGTLVGCPPGTRSSSSSSATGSSPGSPSSRSPWPPPPSSTPSGSGGSGGDSSKARAPGS